MDHKFVPVWLCLFVAVLLFEGPARAGLPECANIRLEDVGSCELRGSLDCDASCNQLGVFKKACATELHTVCRSECTLDADGGCTDSCTESCSKDCDLGINVICIHNCFGECSGDCAADCRDAADPEQCEASCEATCDGECDIQCKPLVDGSCYQHCVECCGGSCKAQANMNCQTTCQDEEFESCELEFRADCDASCEAEGALFCDDEFVLGGADIDDCALALIRQGSLELSADAALGLGLTGDDGEVKVDSLSGGDVRAGCALVGLEQLSGGTQRLPAGLAVFGVLGLFFCSRRRAASRCS